jgi:hypothetical protein
MVGKKIPLGEFHRNVRYICLGGDRGRIYHLIRFLGMRRK